MVTQCWPSQFLLGNWNVPVNEAPACNSMMSPQAAAVIAFCTLPPAETRVTLPGEGVLASAVFMQACGSVATESLVPKFATSPTPQYVLSAPVAGGGGGGGGGGDDGFTDIEARADLVGSATLVAVNVTVV